MPRTLTFFLITTLCVISLSTNTQAQAPRRISVSERRAADAAWTPFFQKFSAAVKTRDREALKAMLHKDFIYYYGSERESVHLQGSDKADKIFVDMAKIHRRDSYTRARDQGWQVLQACINKNVVRDNYVYPTRVATIGSRTNYGEEGAPNATFQFRGGKWYWTDFSFGAGH